MTTLEQLNLSQPLTDVYTAMETDLMIAIARQLAESGEINSTSEWRLKKLAEAGALSKETVQVIASYTGIQSNLITEAIEGAAMGIADRLEPALRACAQDGYISAVDVTPIAESMKNVVTNFRSQAKTDLNLVNTVMQYKAGSAYKALVNKVYEDTKRQELLGVLGKHALEVASGGTSRQEAVRNCIKEFSQKGIPAFVDKRGREWSPDAYINMDIRTTVNNTANAAQDACCDRYGLDLIQISSHMGARPKCALDQGKLYSRSNRSGIAHDGDGNEIPFYPWSSTSYGQPDGILGINCHHHKYPFADGVNFQRYFPYDQEENAKRYEEFQKQRAMERRVRKTSRQADMLEAAGDTEGAKAARRKLREQRRTYREYSKEHGLAVHNDRLTVVKVRNGDTSYKNIYSSCLTDKGESGIINAGSDTVRISAIEQPIEQQHTGKGNPNAILTFDIPLNNRQQQLLERLNGYDSRAVVSKKSVNMADLSALTAKTGDEFAMFTKGNKRLVIRGNSKMVNISIDNAVEISGQGYKWSGHTHPGTDINVLMPSDGDKQILRCFGQEQSVIYNSKGSYQTFGKE